MAEWTIKITNHPSVVNAVYPFKSMAEMERFVDAKDIQIDHIEEIVRWKNHRPDASFLCESKECVSATRMILVKKPKEQYNTGPYNFLNY